MDKFAFVIHPITNSDILRKFPMAKHVPDFLVEKAMRLLPPFKVSEITGIKSSFHEVTGEFIACPLTSSQLLHLPMQESLSKIIASARLAEKNGAQVVGLGALTSVVGDAGVTVAKNVNIPVTTGNSYTVYTALQGTKKAALLMDIDWPKANIVILGATGSIGSVCARWLARENGNLTLVARQLSKLDALANKILYETGVAVKVSDKAHEVLHKADIIIAVSSSLETLVEPRHLKAGAVVCDVARPRDVSYRVAQERDDVLVIEGGVVDVPGYPNFNFNFGFPPGKAFACMAETMILALEKKHACFSLGREMTIEQVEEMGKLATKHGFKLAGFRSFERALSDSDIQMIKKRVKQKKTQLLG